MSLEDFKQALEDKDEILLTVTGRKSGRRVARTVWFVHDSRRLDLLPIGGTTSQWFKNLLANPTVELTADGATVTATAEPITEPGRVEAVVDKFRHKYGNDDVKRYYKSPNAAVEVALTGASS
jgi:deazaflavin-dependent oxidoreductase (nitroreductase family)